ncbi:hypothetical protein CAEBREN_00856 [Caenorhabditis brenneri]|uniref:PAN-3 domain-containing protein n=1 Tax=Caenorhabditis brenneri TaxID=135651 RepID=G0NSR2_CAEBE|nr:hypothetical protein CAEBREN_00856 [Caenorhabditis brenneri]
MAKIYGKVESGPNSTFSPVETTLKQCIDFGFNDPNCFMVTWTEGGCLFYNYSPITKPMLVVETEEDSGSYVAIKTFNANTCPATFNDIDLTFKSMNGDTYPWSKTADGVSFSGCRSGWTRFDRANGRSVCLQALKLSFGVTKPAAISACQQAAADIVGVETKEELTWMFEQKNNLVGQNNSLWVDGERVPECLPPIELKKVAGCNDFTWSNDLTSNVANLSDKNLADMSYYDPYQARPENCLVVWSVHKKLNDASCTQFNAASGVICGYKLL